MDKIYKKKIWKSLNSSDCKFVENWRCLSIYNFCFFFLNIFILFFPFVKCKKNHLPVILNVNIKQFQGTPLSVCFYFTKNFTEKGWSWRCKIINFFLESKRPLLLLELPRFLVKYFFRVFNSFMYKWWTVRIIMEILFCYKL